MKRFQTKHWIYVLVHALLILSGSWLAYTRHPILFPVGTSLLAAGLTGYVIFAYLIISDATQMRLELLTQFGFVTAFDARSTRIKTEYDTRLRQASSAIDIVGFGLSSLREDYLNEFRAWKEKARVRILLLDPDFPSIEASYASQRDTEEGNYAGKIAQDVRAFVHASRELIEPSRFDVRLYRCLPALNIFRIDDELFWGPYLVKNQSRNTPTFVVKRGGILFRVLSQHFDAIWSSDNLSIAVPDAWLRR